MNSPTFPACCGNCNQGRRICTTPQACQVPEPEPQRRPCLPGSAEQVQRVLIGSAVVLLAVIGLVHLVTRFWPF